MTRPYGTGAHWPRASLALHDDLEVADAEPWGDPAQEWRGWRLRFEIYTHTKNERYEEK